MMRRGYVPLVVLAVALACGDDPAAAPAETDASAASTAAESGTSAPSTGNDSTTSADGDTGSSSSESGASAGSCGSGSRCLAAVPEGWLGPIARFRATDGGEPPTCGEGYPDVGLSLLEGLRDVPPAACECECFIDIGTACSVVMYPDVESTTCADFNNFVMGESCKAYDIPSGSVYGSLNTFGGGVGTCSPSSSREVPELGWDAHVFSCGGAVLDDVCDGGEGVCVPAAPDGYAEKLCVFAQGENECPDQGAFTERTLLYSAVDDTRDCSTCECGSAPSFSCDGTFDYYDEEDCSGTLLGSSPPNTCSGPLEDVGSIHVNLVDDPVCGIASEPEPEGTAVPTGTFTYCCEP